MRRAAPVVVSALAASVAPWTAASPATSPSWSFVVRADPGKGAADVEMSIRGWRGESVCIDMPRAARGVSGLVQRVTGAMGEPEWRALERDPDDADCFLLQRPHAVTKVRKAQASPGSPSAPDATGSIELRYRADLSRVGGGHGDVDYAARFGGDWVWNDQAVLLRPEPLPDDGRITIEFALPPEVSVATPWRRLPDEGRGPRFASDALQHDAGAYVALGRLHPLDEIAIGGGVVRPTVLDVAHRAPDATLRAWVEAAMRALVKFYGELPGGPNHEVHVVLAPIEGMDQAGVFGTVMKRRAPSVVLMFGADAVKGFDTDWVAVHELFHMGNPPIAGRFPWFIEGFTTYYTNVLRGRSRAWSPAAMWAEFSSEMARHCQPRYGVPLGEASRTMQSMHSWDRVYWGGACLALRLDVAIRERTRNERSLDDVMRELRKAKAPLDERAVIAALDRAAGADVAWQHLHTKKPIPVEELLAKLGVGKTVADEAQLAAEAPLAWVRRAIMEEAK